MKDKVPKMAKCRLFSCPRGGRPALADSWYSLSYVYFCLLGVLVTVTTGLVVSSITGELPIIGKRLSPTILNDIRLDIK